MMKTKLPGNIVVHLPDSLVDPAVPVGLLGVILALSGARFYRLAIMAPGFALGMLAGLEAPGGPEARLIAGVALGVIGSAVLFLLEKFAVRIGGAFLAAGLAQVTAPLAMGQPSPWYVTLAGGLVGLLLFPALYRRLLPVITAAMGGLCIAWALGSPKDFRLVAAVTAVGCVVQLLSGSGKNAEKTTSD